MNCEFGILYNDAASVILASYYYQSVKLVHKFVSQKETLNYNRKLLKPWKNWMRNINWLVSVEKGRTWEEGRQRVPIWRFGRESWNPGCGSTTPCSSMTPHSSQFPSPQLQRTRICIFSLAFSLYGIQRLNRENWEFYCVCAFAAKSLSFPALFGAKWRGKKKKKVIIL